MYVRKVVSCRTDCSHIDAPRRMAKLHQTVRPQMMHLIGRHDGRSWRRQSKSLGPPDRLWLFVTVRIPPRRQPRAALQSSTKGGGRNPLRGHSGIRSCYLVCYETETDRFARIGQGGEFAEKIDAFVEIVR